MGGAVAVSGVPSARAGLLIQTLLRFAASHGKRLALLFAGVLVPLLGSAKIVEVLWKEKGLGFDGVIPTGTARTVEPGSRPGDDLHHRRGYEYGGPPVTVVALLMLGGLRRWADALFVVLAVGGAVSLNLVAKLAFGRMWPALWASAVPETGFSFPSGHAMGLQGRRHRDRGTGLAYMRPLARFDRWWGRCPRDRSLPGLPRRALPIGRSRQMGRFAGMGPRRKRSDPRCRNT